MAKIKKIKAREILDSRGNPTVEAMVKLENGSIGCDSVPSGASTGKFEALELRDNDSSRFQGQGVLKAVKNIREEIAPKLIGRESSDQQKIDWLMKELDGTKDKSRLGANAILAVSMAVCRASARVDRKPLYQYLAETYQFPSNYSLPTPLFNIFNGGKHAGNRLSIQEFMIIPKKETKFKEKLRLGAEVYQRLKEILKENNYSTGVGDEGGFAPEIENPKDVLELIVKAGEKAGYCAGDDFVLGLDVAASEFAEKNGDHFQYKMNGFDTLNSKGLANYLIELSQEFPIFSIEDPLDQEDWQGWHEMTKKAGDKTQLVGDDLFVTNQDRLKRGIEGKVANAILVKLNQIGTVSETIETIKLAHSKNYASIISHRSGETGDVFIADLAVATGSSQIKSGAPARFERVSKYNRLMKIEDGLRKDQD